MGAGGGVTPTNRWRRHRLPITGRAAGHWAYAARNATKSKGTASLKLDSDPLGSQFLNDLADALTAGVGL